MEQPEQFRRWIRAVRRHLALFLTGVGSALFGLIGQPLGLSVAIGWSTVVLGLLLILASSYKAFAEVDGQLWEVTKRFDVTVTNAFVWQPDPTSPILALEMLNRGAPGRFRASIASPIEGTTNTGHLPPGYGTGARLAWEELDGGEPAELGISETKALRIARIYPMTRRMHLVVAPGFVEGIALSTETPQLGIIVRLSEADGPNYVLCKITLKFESSGFAIATFDTAPPNEVLPHQSITW